MCGGVPAAMNSRRAREWRWAAWKTSVGVIVRSPDYLSSTGQMSGTLGAEQDAGVLKVDQLVVGPEGVLDAADAGDHVAGLQMELPNDAGQAAQGHPRRAGGKEPVLVKVVK